MSNLLFLGFGFGTSIFGILYAVLAIYCIIDIIQSSFKDTTTKLLWLVVVLLAPFLGSVAYLIAGRSGKRW
ncbi:PLDc N-terminal domain-containing protein [Mucilaginibacter calamicampi]|uniref:PLDc N-terminal domain-containing protein n=1 Tax=Mucilaginibacter calamicampi TaxID=1302352 RepID=A0ABW2YVP9_9SPHI